MEKYGTTYCRNRSVVEKHSSGNGFLRVIGFCTALASPEAEADISKQTQLDAQRQLGPLETVVGSVPHRMWLREGGVWASINSLVRSEQIDLIAVGASGQSDFKKFLVGSVAEEVIRKATRPLLSVGPHAPRNSGGAAQLAQLLYVTKLWEDSHDGLQYAIQMAIRYRSRLVLLHVVEQEAPYRTYSPGGRRDWGEACRHGRAPRRSLGYAPSRQSV